MTDQKFTDAETVKALECCNTPGSCSECPYYVINEVEYDGSCVQNLIMDILPIINRQKAEMERLQAVHADMTESLRLAAEANKDMQAEIEAKEEEYADLLGQRNAVEMMLENIRTEAIKDFAKFLIDHSTDNTIFIADLPDLVIEMMEDHNESQNT